MCRIPLMSMTRDIGQRTRFMTVTTPLHVELVIQRTIDVQKIDDQCLDVCVGLVVPPFVRTPNPLEKDTKFKSFVCTHKNMSVLEWSFTRILVRKMQIPSPLSAHTKTWSCGTVTWSCGTVVVTFQNVSDPSEVSGCPDNSLRYHRSQPEFPPVNGFPGLFSRLVTQEIPEKVVWLVSG